jgi:hypothetical protein
MTDLRTSLGDPTALGHARAVAHAAAQPLTKAARANLPAAPGDSHSNLGWSRDLAMFLTHPMPAVSGPVQVGLSLAPLVMTLMQSGQRIAELALSGESLTEVESWLDDQLKTAGLKSASVIKVTYDMPQDVTSLVVFPANGPDLAVMAAWFSLASTALDALIADLAGTSAKTSEIRCWPHHFDIATYVSLEAGDAETAKGVGVGLSPGDGSYDQPYFYANPWPHLDVASLPSPVTPGHWHTDGFVGAIATGQEILSLDDIANRTAAFVQDSFSLGRKLIGA